MAIKSKADLLIDINTLLADNTSRAISEQDVRDVLTNIKDTLLEHPSEAAAAGAFDGTETFTMIQGGNDVVTDLEELKAWVNLYDFVGGMALTFDKNKQYGLTAAPETGAAFTVSHVGAVRQTKVMVIHQAGAEPAYPASFLKLYGAYNTAKLNYYEFTYIDSTHVLYKIFQH